MSDPVKNVEIEDVLSSIRRLVSAEDPGTEPRGDGPNGRSAPRDVREQRLVLTPAQRVDAPVEDTAAEAETQATPAPEADLHEADTQEQAAAGLSAAMPEPSEPDEAGDAPVEASFETESINDHGLEHGLAMALEEALADAEAVRQADLQPGAEHDGYDDIEDADYVEVTDEEVAAAERVSDAPLQMPEFIMRRALEKDAAPDEVDAEADQAEASEAEAEPAPAEEAEALGLGALTLDESFELPSEAAEDEGLAEDDWGSDLAEDTLEAGLGEGLDDDASTSLEEALDDLANTAS